MSDQSHDRRDEGTTVAEAARILGITEGAVRKRVERGKLAAERATDGRLIVHIDSDTTATDTTRDRPRQSRDERYTRSLEEQVEYLRSQLDVRAEEIQRRDVIISQLTQANAALAARVPELEAAQEPSEAAQDVAEPAARANPSNAEPGAQEGVQRPWWRRVFGG